MSNKDQIVEAEVKPDDIPYENCLNCGTELVGGYCHKCGQQATSKTPTVGDFLHEYVINAFIWDPQFFKTIGTLLRRPGQLTSDYMDGKFVSQEHPLKLNMFLLFVFVSMFLIFSSKSDEDSVRNLLHDERTYPELQVEFYKKDADYAVKLATSPRDTVQIYTPLELAQEYPDVIAKVEVIEDSQDSGLDKWVATVPRVFIEDEIIVLNDEGYYFFNQEDGTVAGDLGMVISIWEKVVDLTTTYFPMLVLLTVPLLAMAVSFIQRKSRVPFIHHFIFALHYTAFLELLMMVLYALYLTVDPSMGLLQWVLRIASGVYLTMAIHRVYEPSSWFKSLLKALFTYVIYLINCGVVLIIFCIIFCIIAAVSVLA